MVDSIAAGETDAALMSKQDRLELLALRERAARFKMSPLAAMDEWVRARETVDGEILTACERWKNRLTQFKRISVQEAVEKYKAKFVLKRAARAKGLSKELGRKLSPEEIAKNILPKSYQVTLPVFVAAFGERYLDELTKDEIEGWFQSKGGNSGWTANTFRKRVVTLFRWARNSGFLPQDQITEAEKTERSEEDPPKREVITPTTLARILFLLKDGIDFGDLTKKHEPRPDLIPAVAVSAFAGYRSCEGDLQTWEDLDMGERQGAVTKAKKGTEADRSTNLSECCIEWLELTPEAQRKGPIHPWKTEIHTMIRNHLVRTIGLHLPGNTFRKSWESYRYVLSHDDGEATSEESGHTQSVHAKHYRNPRAKKSHAELWFEVYPDLVHRQLFMINHGHASGLLKPDDFEQPKRSGRR
eukprot:TRINITY_DN41126_c0_g1_i1.p1 TRINITY_DN41126_c0_g1~~TRINITY_DN41126_c0_g1_i1.p1  ORF type:complete len:415 (-),score=40.85 TRINITY_DN41126_c0_g1_i1:428-1672(-)